ncbi:phosphatidylglycerophosphatase A [Acinetobacter baumannii]|uniref:phosphatidylglycerophosphatase A family protein n=1 Tax=Acinetobacter baumannii TaxID=470 RepID=UPI0009352966|nr:phosphatidylglycerophosphatase A [Acinetobacter baumannii]MDC5057727.1 phosphatidylglycerophosphatase A [Acinetobacter baumannii]MDO7419052.1 phosphatidylglycerophosphatase A [Acinetobacter baumannii]MDV7433013.1 phosphatidylglycerophosphatase A [Acinetobacter baumannii]SSR34111.1 phosphatidylglycerophosphatase A [Acinetobacter baumannii]HCA5043437.1 phosphatidylglycerophosphatase A [Acinetobacter baumannii]
MDTNTLHKPLIHFKDMSWFNRCIVFCGVGFGSGLAPKAPGTFGSAFALLFVPIWLSLGFTLSLIAILIMSVVGIYICGQTAKVINVHDDGRIVWDEFAGQSITFLPLLYLQQINWIWVITGFILFRIFDVWKPWPIRVIDRQVHGGFGIMLDDIIAGVWAALCTLIIIHLS